MNRYLIMAGILLVLAGFGWPWIVRGAHALWYLPGNIVIRREHVTVYLPITLSIIASIVLTVIFAVFRR